MQNEKTISRKKLRFHKISRYDGWMRSKETETRHAKEQATKKLIRRRNKLIWQNNNTENTLRSYKDDINNGCRLPTDISAVVKLFMRCSKCPSAEGVFCETTCIQLHLILNTTQQMSGKHVQYVLHLSNILHNKMTKMITTIFPWEI